MAMREKDATRPRRQHGQNAAVLPMDRVTNRLAGKAHGDAERNAKKAANRYQTGLRTQYTYRKEGAPEIRAVHDFLLLSDGAARQAVSLLAFAQRIDLEGMTERQVVELYHATLAQEKAAEAEDTRKDLGRGTGWLDRALATERDMAFDALKAGCERFFAERRTPAERVWS